MSYGVGDDTGSTIVACPLQMLISVRHRIGSCPKLLFVKRWKSTLPFPDPIGGKKAVISNEVNVILEECFYWN